MSPSNKSASFDLRIALTLLNALPLIASDINLSVMGSTAKSLQCSIGDIQSTLSLYLVSLGLAQLIYGPLSDTYGRRFPLLVGLTLFTVASYICASADSFITFAIGRSLQAFGAGAGVAISRAIIADLFDERASARIFTTIFPVVGASPAFSPILGEYITTQFSWRAPFTFTAAVGLMTLLLIIFRIPETAALSKNKSLTMQFNQYPKLLLKPLFWAYTANLGIEAAIFLVSLSASPVIFNAMGAPADLARYCYMSISLSYIFASIAAYSLVLRYTIKRLIGVGYTCYVVGASALVFLNLIGAEGPAPLFITIAIITLGHGFLSPLSYAAGVSSIPSHSGAASGLMGALQLITGAAALHFISLFDHGVKQLGWFLLTCAVIGSLAFPLLLYLADRKSRP